MIAFFCVFLLDLLFPAVAEEIWRQIIFCSSHPDVFCKFSLRCCCFRKFELKIGRALVGQWSGRFFCFDFCNFALEEAVLIQNCENQRDFVFFLRFGIFSNFFGGANTATCLRPKDTEKLETMFSLKKREKTSRRDSSQEQC